MQELIEKLIANLGISSQTAESAIGIILNFIKSHVSSDQLGDLFSKLPGAEQLASSAENLTEQNSGGLMGMVSGMLGDQAGDLMKTVSALQATGLDTDQIGSVASQFIEFAKEKADPALLEQISSQIPGLDQIIKK